MAQGSEDPLDTRRGWEEAKAEQKRWAMQGLLMFVIGLALSLVRSHLQGGADCRERPARHIQA
jgi:hypothetical protein